MAKCPKQLEVYIDKNYKWFEQSIVAVCRADLASYKKFSPVLCLKSGTKDKHSDDFEEPYNNIIYDAIRGYNCLFEGASEGIFKPIGVAQLQTVLNERASKGEMVGFSEIPDIVKYFEDVILKQDSGVEAIYLVNTGIPYYLKSVRAKKIINSASLLGVNLDDLTLICEKDIELINKLEDGGKLLVDVPDRIELADIDEFDDPNKVLIETLDCDIPKLNETISSFRKGHAYLFIGGTGSGKTIIACQLASAFSYINGASGLYISTEQKHDELYRRIVSNKCSIPHRTISQGIFKDKLTPNEVQRYLDFRIKANSLNSGDAQFINWGNFQKQADINMIKKIEDEIELYEKESGKKVEYVILDWIGGALGSMAEAGDKTRHIYQAAADALEELCRKRNFVAIAFAQAVPASVNKVKIDSQDLSECKTMGRNYSAIIGISSLYSEEYAKQVDQEKSKKRKDYRVGSELDEAATYATKQFLFISKSRFGDPKAVPFKREYEYQRIAPWV
jgi:replicative DNA helicase